MYMLTKVRNHNNKIDKYIEIEERNENILIKSLKLLKLRCYFY